MMVVSSGNCVDMHLLRFVNKKVYDEQFEIVLLE